MPTTTITLGDLPDDDFGLPRVTTLPIFTDAGDALTRAVRFRQGVLLYGEKGIGKSESVEEKLASFREKERARQRGNAKYRPRKVFYVKMLTERTVRGALVYLTKKLTGNCVERVHGRLKQDDELRDELVRFFRMRNIVALVVDEAERTPVGVLEGLRDLMASAEGDKAEALNDGASAVPAPLALPRDRADAVDPSNAGADSDAPLVYATGIGVLVVGSTQAYQKLSGSADRGQRWARAIHVQAPGLAEVVTIFAAWFPRFAEHVASVGDGAWANYLSSQLVRSGRIDFRTLRDLARDYITLMRRHDPSITRREDVLFFKPLFEFAISRLGWDGGESTAGNAHG